MGGSVFIETFKRSWQTMFYWGLAFGIIGMMVILMIPDAEFLNSMKELVESLPPFLMAMVGVGDDVNFIATPEGFLAVGVFGKMALVFAAYPVIMAMRITVNDEDEGIMDVVLSLPLPRWRVVLEGFLGYFLSIVLVVLMLFAGVWLGTQLSTVEIDLNRVAATVLTVLPGLTLILSATLFIGTLLRRRRWVIGTATVFVVASFMLDTVGSMLHGSAISEPMRQVSFFYYYNATNVMKDGIMWGNILLLVVISVVLVAASVFTYQRRDIGV